MERQDGVSVARPQGAGERLLDETEYERLEAELVALAVRIQRATFRQLCIVRELETRGNLAWRGFRSCAHYLNWRIGLDLGAAREKVRVALALPKLPKTSAALEAGEISYAKVRAITRVATADNEDVFLTMARYGTASHVEKTVRLYRRVTVGDAAVAARQHEGRYLQTYWDEDGMLVISGRLTPEVGAAVQAALQKALVDGTPGDAAQGATGKDSSGAVLASSKSEPPRPSLSQRRADAIGLVARAAAQAMAGGGEGDRPTVLVHVDAQLLGARPGSNGEAGAGRVSAETSDALLPARPTASLGAADARKAEADRRAPGRCDLEGAGSVSAETSRRLACDAVLRRVEHDAGGLVIAIGRKRRSIPPGLRHVLRERDGGCRFPGCGARLFTDGHHIRHWADGGETSPDNVVELCAFHHRLVHEGGWRIEGRPDGELRFVGPLGSVPAVPPMVDDWHELTALEATGAALDMPCWGGDRADYDIIIDGILELDRNAAARRAASA